MRSLRLIALVAIPAQLAFGQAPTSRGNPLTLDEAIITARRNNPTYLNIQNGLRTANAQVRQSYAALLPSSNASISSGYQQGGTQFVQGIALPGSSDSYQSSYRISLSYSIAPSIAFIPKAARAQRDASEADINSYAEQLRAQVTNQYITALQSAATAAVNDTLVQSAAAQLDLVNAKVRVGAGTIVEVRTAEVALGQAQVAALQSHNQAQLDKLRLFQYMGVPADTGATLTTQFSLSTPSYSLDSLISLAHRVNPDVAARQSRLTSSELQVKVAKSQYLPSLFSSTGYGAQAFGFTDSEILASQAEAQTAASFKSCLSGDSLRVGAGLKPRGCGSGVLAPEQLDAIRSSNKPFKFNKAPYGLQASLSLPLFNGYAREANIEQNKVARDNAANDLRARNLQVNTDVTQAYLTLIAQTKTVELQTQNAAKASEELAAAQERYKVGAATFLDVTVARGTFEKAQIDRVNAIYEYHKAFANLENAVGRPLR
jgi:outer membrane protein